MNPYTYKKRKGRAAQAPQPAPIPPAGGGSWLKEVCNANISSAVALAFVIFAAGSVASMAAIAYPTLAMDNSVNLVAMAHSSEQPRVLGASTTIVIDDAALEAGDPSGAVSAKPVSFDSTIGRWDYNINYTISNLVGSATVSIGSYAVQSNITASGNVETGAILKPSMIYHLSLWTTDQSGAVVILDKMEIKTGKARTGTTPPMPLPCMQGQSPSSTPVTSSTTPSAFCLKTTSGKPMCLPLPCGIRPDQGMSQGEGSGHFWPMGTGSTTPPSTFMPQFQHSAPSGQSPSGNQ